MADAMTILPDGREALQALGLSTFDDVMNLSGGELVSEHAHRDTVRIDVDLADGPWRLFLKRDYAVPAKHIREDLLSGRRPAAQPIREWRAIEQCERRALPAMRRLACGQRTRLGLPRQAWLLVEAVPATETLDEALRRVSRDRDDARATRQRTALGCAVGRLMARIHGAGLAWPDMVAKHVYVAWRHDVDPPRWDLHLIDLERLTAGADETTHRRDIERLFRSLIGHGLRGSDMLRFARAYAGRMEEPWSAARPALTREVGWAGGLFREQRESDRDRLPMPDAAPEPHLRRFVRRGHVRVNEAYEGLLEAAGLKGIDAVFAWHAGQRLDKSNIGTWRQRWRIGLSGPGGGVHTCYLKRYDRPPPLEQLRRVVLRRAEHSTAWWEWRKIRQLAEAGIPAPTPIAHGEQMRGWLERRSFIITEGIDGDSLERWVPAHLGPSGDVDWRHRRDLVLLLARLVCRLHRHRLIHRDLYLSHVFISHNSDGEPVLWLIDLQRLFTPRLRWRRWQVKDLAALHYSTPSDCVPATERVRFLRAYLGVERLGSEGRQLVRRVLARTRRTARHNRAERSSPS